MTQVAVGLAREGYNVFTYSIGNFPTLRCMEQIRYDVCYHQANVKIVAVGAGYAYGPQGVSHHTTEDIAMLRAIPNMLVCAPADPVEAGAAARYMADYSGPGYVRINKSGEPCIHDPSVQLTIAPGNFLSIRSGRSTAVLSTGAMLSVVLKDVAQHALNYAVYSVPFIGNYKRQGLIDLTEQFEEIVTVEEHQLNGGFGSSIMEALGDLYSERVIERMPRVRRIGIPNKFFGMSGSQDYLRTVAKLDLMSGRSERK
jgi:transketolase